MLYFRQWLAVLLAQEFERNTVVNLEMQGVYIRGRELGDNSTLLLEVQRRTRRDERYSVRKDFRNQKRSLSVYTANIFPRAISSLSRTPPSPI